MNKGQAYEVPELWIGSYTIHEELGPHIYYLQSLDGRVDNLPVIGQDLEHHFQ